MHVTAAEETVTGMTPVPLAEMIPAVHFAIPPIFWCAAAVGVAILVILLSVSLFYMMRIKQLQEKYSAKAQQLMLVMDSISEGMVTADTEGRIRLMNPAACELTHYSLEEVEGRVVTEVLHRVTLASGAPLPSLVEKTLRDGRVHRDTRAVLLVGKDGYQIPVTECASPILDKKGNIIGAVFVFWNLKEEYAAKDRLQWNDLLLMQASDVAKIQFFVCDRMGEFYNAPVRTENWGWRGDKPMHPREWIHPEDLEDFLRAWRAMVNGESLMLSVTYRAPAGAADVRYFNMQAVPVPDSAGKVFFGGIIQDVTEAKKQEFHLQELLKKQERPAGEKTDGSV